jgi:hypothetical protein
MDVLVGESFLVEAEVVQFLLVEGLQDILGL